MVASRRTADRALPIVLALLLAVDVTRAVQDMPVAAVRELYQEAMAAYQKKDYAVYLQKMLAVSAERPVQPTFLRRLAGAYALNGKAADAARILRKMAALSLYDDALDDPDFSSVRGDAEVRIASRAHEALLNRRVGTSDVAWTIHDRMLTPEGITYDTASRAFFVSSQFERKIVRIEASGAVQDFIASGKDGVWMVFGISVDPARRLLWAVSAAESEMQGFTKADANATGIFAFEIATGKLVRKYELAERSPAHRFDDLTVAPNGRVFASDGGSGAIYTIAPGGTTLDVFVAPGTMQGPNGLTTSPDGKWLFVSDYAGYIFRVDTGTKAIIRLIAPPDIALYGIDGLAWHSGSLVGVQNGVEPARVVQLNLSADTTRIVGARILDMNHPRVAEPTIGVVVGDSYYYVANSFGAFLRQPDSVLADQPLADPVILKIKIG